MALRKRNHRIRSEEKDKFEIQISIVFLETRKSGRVAISTLRVALREMEVCHANCDKFLKEGVDR